MDFNDLIAEFSNPTHPIKCFQNNKEIDPYPMRQLDELVDNYMINQALDEINVFVPAQIQNQIILSLKTPDTDILVQANSGTGKTLAFVLSMMLHVEKTINQLQVIYLCNTPNLSLKVFDLFKKLNNYTNFKGGVCVDQMNNPDTDSQLIFGTPLSVFLFIYGKVRVDLSRTKLVIVDEANTFFDSSSVYRDLSIELLNFSPKIQFAIFSNTFSNETLSLIKKLKPNIIQINEPQTKAFLNPSEINQINNDFIQKIDPRDIKTEEADKIALLEKKRENATRLLEQKKADERRIQAKKEKDERKRNDAIITQQAKKKEGERLAQQAKEKEEERLAQQAKKKEEERKAQQAKKKVEEERKARLAREKAEEEERIAILEKEKMDKKIARTMKKVEDEAKKEIEEKNKSAFLQNYTNFTYSKNHPKDISEILGKLTASFIVVDFLFPFCKQMKIASLHAAIVSKTDCILLSLENNEEISIFKNFLLLFKKQLFIVNEIRELFILKKSYKIEIPKDKIYSKLSLDGINEKDSFLVEVFAYKSRLLRDEKYRLCAQKYFSTDADFPINEQNMLFLFSDALVYHETISRQFTEENEDDMYFNFLASI